MMHATPAIGDSDQWVRLVARITEGDEDGIEELYITLAGLVRGRAMHLVGVDSIEDAIHEVFVIVLQAVQEGELRDPARLMGFVRIVAQRRAVAHLRAAIFRRRRFQTELVEPRAPRSDSPDNQVEEQDRSMRANRLLRRLNLRDREILDRFYILEQPLDQICTEMHLTLTQFRLFKSRALGRCSSIAHGTA
jgi:RNA polymerase sigma-70 factor (ECF subfamily)